MNYVFTCDCGQKFKVPETYLGRTVKCPKCKSQTVIRREAVVEVREPGQRPTPAPQVPVPQTKPRGAHPAAPSGAVLPDSRQTAVKESVGQPKTVPSLPPTPNVSVSKASTTKADPPAVQNPPSIGIAPKAAPAVQPQGTADAGLEYPWDPDPEKAARAWQYYERKEVQVYACQCREYLNFPLRADAVSKALLPLQLEIYPDFVGLDFREEEPGWLAALFLAIRDKLPAWAQPVAEFVLVTVAMVLGMIAEMGCLGIIFVPFVLVATVILSIVTVPLWIGPFLVFLVARVVWEQINRRRIASIAQRVRANPRSPFAIKQMYKRSQPVPRVWDRGEVQQLVLVEMRHGLRRRACLLFVQDSPLPHNPGSGGLGLLVWIGRLLQAQRRIYVVRLEHVDEAPRAGQLAAQALNLPLTHGQFTLFGYSLS